MLTADEPSGPLHFMLGDVAGKGVAASILMANLQAIFRSLVPLGLPLRGLVEQANRLFSGSTLPNSYATIIVGRLQSAGVLMTDDLLFLYSDDVSEARNPAKRTYGSQRLGSALADVGGTAVDDVLRACLGDLADFRDGETQEDDVTVLAGRRDAP